MSNEFAGTIVFTDADSGALKLRRWEIRVVSGQDAGNKAGLSRGTLLVGSAASNDLVLRDPRVSRAHLELKLLEDGLQVRDIGSSNGTFQGNARLTDSMLMGSAVLRLGDTELALEPADEEIALNADEARLGEMVGGSPPMRQLFATVSRIAPTDVTVLIEGETGTGKELVAHELHRLSDRASGPMVVIDCGALPAGLVESELFGHVRGAFTGAHADRDGALARADGGTLLLDEVGELPLELQPKLLRALEQRSFKRVGDDRVRRADLRVVAATSRNLTEEVKYGRFRLDLLYRLAVVRLHVPPLRQRLEDLAELLRWLAASIGTRDLVVPEAAIARLSRHSWPGNVRELRNVVSHALALRPNSTILELPDVLGLEDEQVVAAPSAPRASVDAGGNYREAKAEAIAEFERCYLNTLLTRHDWNVSGAAREAGVDRNYLHRLIKRHDIKRP